jgi:aminomethyltransferase
LGFAVNLKERSFIGSEVLQRRSSEKLPVQRVGLRLDGRRAAREGASLFDSDNREVGSVTSGTFSPTLQTPIGMAYVAAELAVVGNALDVDIRGTRATAEIVKLPFYKRA